MTNKLSRFLLKLLEHQMNALKNETFSDLTQESDADLLEMISWKDDIETRNQAFTEFYKRHITFLYSLVHTVCYKFYNNYEMSTVITNNVLINVYNYSGSFKVEGTQTEAYIKNKIEAWLASIARQEMIVLFATSKKAQEEQAAYSKMITSSTTDRSTVSYNEDVVKKAFAQLKPREQDILRTYWLFYEKGTGTQAKNMPPGILEELAKRYETTSLNIRQIISRSNKTVKEFLLKKYKTSK